MDNAESKPVKSVWGRIQSTDEDLVQEPIVSLMEIMEEQSLEEERFGDHTHSYSYQLDENCDADPDCSRDYLLAIELSRDPDCSADELVAMKLQREFDRELELSQKFEESKASTGKVTALLASDPYHYTKEEHEESSEEEEDDEEMREFATNLLYENHASDFPSCGFVKNTDGSYLTKHDHDVSEKKCSEKALQLPLALPTGDFTEHRIGSKALNALRIFGKSECKRQMRLKDKEQKATSEMSVDVRTRLILLKWINSGQFDRVEEIIATGKESAVLHAISGGCGSSSRLQKDEEEEQIEDDSEQLNEGTVSEEKELQTDVGGQSHFAVKVYKTTLAGFKNRSEYVKDDFRFKNPRRVMKIWAEKEFLNLKRLRKANIMCPTPIKLKRHILLMSMIGDTRPAQKLKELHWENQQMRENAFVQVREIVNRMFKECNLVHGDLSEFNLLYHSGTVYVIDMAQAMDISHPSSLRFLHRDIVNVLDFFGRLGCESLPTPHSMFGEVTGIDFDPEQDLYVQVESFERENRSVSIREAKATPANYELQSYQMEKTGRPDSPSSPYN